MCLEEPKAPAVGIKGKTNHEKKYMEERRKTIETKQLTKNPTQSDSKFRSLAWQEDNNVTMPHDMIRNTSKFEQICHQTKSRSRNTTWQITGGCASTSYYQDSTEINKKRSFRHNLYGERRHTVVSYRLLVVAVSAWRGRGRILSSYARSL